MEVGSVNGQRIQPLPPVAARGPGPHGDAAGGPASVPKKEPAEPSEEQVQRHAQVQSNSLIVSTSKGRIVIDEESKRLVVQILDQDNNVLKQIPPEELLKVLAHMRELDQKLFDVRA